MVAVPRRSFLALPSPERLTAAIGESLSFAVRRSGLALVVRKTLARRKVSILVYHDPDPAMLERHLAYLSKRHHFLPLGRFVEAIQSGDGRSLPENGVIVTLDDGHRGNVRLAPLFERYGVVPTIYVCSQIVDTNRRFWFLAVPDPEPFKTMPWREALASLERSVGFSPTSEDATNGRHALTGDELRLLKEHAEIGSHTRFHPILPECSDEEAEEEIARSRAEVEALVGSPCQHFSYPNGDYTERELALVKAAGYASARTMEIGWNDVDSDPFRLKVLGIRDDMSLNRLAADLSGVTNRVGVLRRAVVRRLTGGLRGSETGATERVVQA